MQFDLYIKLRTDLIFLDKIKIDNFDDKSIYTNKTKFPIEKYINDFTFFTKNYDNVEIISKLGFNLDQIISNMEKSEKDIIWSIYSNEYAVEAILANYINKNNISSKLFDFNIDLSRHHI